jgi:pimeloyl-ACP methyl ester carboxylesterase
MPYVNNKGVRIYYEMEGKGPSIVLAHGVSGNLNHWRRVGGYLDVLKNDFQLILFDARGHGRSDKPHDPSAYGSKMTDDVVSILDDIGIKKAHYFGYSMGARIGFYVATIHADRFLSFILGGAGVIDAATAGARAEVTRIIANTQKDPEGVFAALERQFGRRLTSEEKEEMSANDSEALLALRSALSNMPILTKEYLSVISVPCLLYCGDVDPRYRGAKEAAGYIPHAKFVSLPGLDHRPAFARSDLILPHVMEFLAQVSKKK